MKIYTRTGDKGTTALFGGGRVPKNHARIEAYGTVDEVNALLGLAHAYASDDPALEPLAGLLQRIQHELFVLGGDLATPPESRASVPRITDAHITALEQDIDHFEEALEPLKHFILPGGTPAAATLHVARTVCRRAERHVVALTQAEEISHTNVQYLNRLSDLLFVLARWANNQAGRADILWKPEKGPSGG